MVQQIFNCRSLIQKHLGRQMELLHNFIDFKKAFDLVWHDGLWSALIKFKISLNIINMIK